MDDSNSHHDRKRSDGDAVIVRAFRRSLLVIALFAVFIAIATYFRSPPGDRPPAGDAKPATAPREAEVEPQRIPDLPFSDITDESGIEFVHVNGAYGDRLLPETMGSGVAFFDYDGDGDADLLLVNSDYWPGHRPEGASVRYMALYQNNGRGHFQDVTRAAGLELALYGMGVALGDYDGDGDQDIFLTALGTNRLLRNEGGVFEDVTVLAGVGGAEDAWSTSAAFFDADNDGDLDLFVANYVRWSKETDFEVDFRLTGIGRAYGPPTAFEGSYCYLYFNQGDGSFLDVSSAAGIQVDNSATNRPVGKALAIALADIDNDGWMDVAVANDTVRNFLFRNLGDGRFEEIGTLAGMAFDRNGAATGAMGMDVAHFRNDQELGLAVGNFANEMTSFYVTQGASLPMADEAIIEGIGPGSRQVLTFGLFFFDADLDGRLDLLQANGHLEQEINQVQPSQEYAQPPQLFWNCGADCRASFVQVPAENIGDLARPLVGRGAAYADIDGDGDLDVVITQNGGRARLFRNQQDSGHHWLRIRLLAGEGNRDAIGARVVVRTGDLEQHRQVMPTRSYLSQVELPLTFGLGAADTVDEVRVQWPDGVAETLIQLPVDRSIVVERQVLR